MILEVAQVAILPGHESAFEADLEPGRRRGAAAGGRMRLVHRARLVRRAAARLHVHHRLGDPRGPHRGVPRVGPVRALARADRPALRRRSRRRALRLTARRPYGTASPAVNSPCVRLRYLVIVIT